MCPCPWIFRSGRTESRLIDAGLFELIVSCYDMIWIQVSCKLAPHVVDSFSFRRLSELSSAHFLPVSCCRLTLLSLILSISYRQVHTGVSFLYLEWFSRIQEYNITWIPLIVLTSFRFFSKSFCPRNLGMWALFFFRPSSTVS